MKTFKSCAALVILLSGLTGCGSSGNSVPFITPIPPVYIPPTSTTPPRTDLLYGYYGDILEETKTHTNLFFAVAWVSMAEQLQQLIDAKNAGKKLMVDMAAQMGLPFDVVAATPRVRARIQQFKDAGILPAIVALYPLDEPDLHGMSASDVNAMHGMVRSVATEFGVNPAIAVVYAATQTYPGIESADWIGFDNYDAGNSIFTNGELWNLKSKMRPDQKIILVPEGKLNPEKFLEVAESDKQVCCLIPFAWNSFGGIVGIRSNGMGTVYGETGKKIVGTVIP